MPESQPQAVRCENDLALIFIGQLIGRSMDDADASVSQLTRTVQKLIHHHHEEGSTGVSSKEAAQCVITAMQFYDLLSQRLRHIQSCIEESTLDGKGYEAMLAELARFPGGQEQRRFDPTDKLEFF